jgi:hypothetical protein
VVVIAYTLGAYLVVRAVLELVMIDYGDTSSYRDDWGGPSLMGVLAVHCLPGVIALVAMVWGLRRLRRAGSRYASVPNASRCVDLARPCCFSHRRSGRRTRPGRSGRTAPVIDQGAVAVDARCGGEGVQVGVHDTSTVNGLTTSITAAFAASPRIWNHSSSSHTRHDEECQVGERREADAVAAGDAFDR